jgi:hypothetical protein
MQEGGVSEGAVGRGSIYPWNCDVANIYMILRALEILRPQKVLELGTFEGRTTVEMARVISVYAKILPQPVKFYTFDAGGPVSCYGPGDEVVPNWETDPFWIEAGWAEVKSARGLRLEQTYEGVNLKFIEGLTKLTLPGAMAEFGTWDFCFQDSVHGLKLQIEEWEHLKPKSKVGSVILFDDITAEHPLRDWFPKNNPGWDYRWTDKGRKQLWAERLK